MNLTEIRKEAEASPFRSTARSLTPDDVDLFESLCRDCPDCYVRVYSRFGFVPNSYRWPCRIEYIQRSHGEVITGWVDAHRSNANGPHYVTRKEKQA